MDKDKVLDYLMKSQDTEQVLLRLLRFGMQSIEPMLDAAERPDYADIICEKYSREPGPRRYDFNHDAGFILAFAFTTHMHDRLGPVCALVYKAFNYAESSDMRSALEATMKTLFLLDDLTGEKGHAAGALFTAHHLLPKVNEAAMITPPGE